MSRKSTYSVAVDGSEDFEAPRRKHKKHNAWKYILTFLAGQFSFLFVGTLAISYLATGPEVGVVDPDNKILSENSSNLSLLQLISKLMEGNNGEVKTLDDMSEYVNVDSIVQQIQDALTEKLGIEIDCSSLKTTEFSSIGEWAKDTLGGIEVVALLEKFGIADSLPSFVDGIVKKKIQKVDQYGNLMFDGQLKNTETGALLYNDDNTPKYNQKLDGDNQPMFDDDNNPIWDKGEPVYEKEQKVDQYGNLMFDKQLKDSVTGDLLYNDDNTPKYEQMRDTQGNLMYDDGGNPVWDKGNPVDSDTNKLVSKTVNELIGGGFDFSSILGELTLASVLGDDAFADGGSFAMLASLKDTPILDLGTELFDLKLCDLLGATDGLLGPDGAFGQKTINDLKDDPLKGLQIVDVMPDAAGDEGILGTIAYAFISADSFPTDAPTTAPAEPKRGDYYLDMTDPAHPEGVKKYWNADDNAWKNFQTLSDIVGDITIGQAVGGDKNDAASILQKLWDYKPSELSNAINTLTLEDVLGSDNYPSTGVLAALRNTTVSGLSDAVNQLQLKDVLACDSGLLKTLAGCFVMDWFPASGTESDTAPSEHVKFTAWTDTSVTPSVKKFWNGEAWEEYQTLSSKISNITIGEAMGTDYDSASNLMKKLWNYKPSELSSAIDNLYISDVISGGITIGNITLTDTKISELSTKISSLTVYDFFGNTIYKNSNKDDGLTGIWKYLLTDPDSGTDVSQTALLTDMGSLMGNVAKNLQTATLYDLFNDGLINTTMDNLNKQIPVDKTNPLGPTQALGSLTIAGVIAYLAA